MEMVGQISFVVNKGLSEWQSGHCARKGEDNCAKANCER